MKKQDATGAGLALLGAIFAASPAMSQSLPFNGTRENVNPVAPPGGRCVPPYFNTVNIAPGALSSTGTSNISNFTSTQSHCITSPPPTSLVDGLFTYRFEAGDTIFGTYTGNVTTSATPGSFSAVENLIITGGTGRFIGASGTISDNGVLQFANGNGIFQGTLSGSILAPTTTMSGTFSTALGVPSAATGDYSTAIGAFSFAPGTRSTAVGTFAEAVGTSTVAVGDNSFASGSSAIAFGQNSRSTNNFTVAIGAGSVSSGLNSTAVGPFTQALGRGATALGNGAVATAQGSVAIGVRSTASGLNSTALGGLATATFAGSTAIGNRAVTTADNQVTLGATGTSVRVGDIDASTAAQQASSVGVATVDANGTLGRNTNVLPTIATLQSGQASQGAAITTLQTGQLSQGSAIAALQNDSLSLFDLARENRSDIREANEGVAIAMAMDTPAIPAGAKVALSGGIGFFKNRAALASAISLAVGPMSSVSAGFGYGFNSKKIGARAGFQIAW